jgi:hypothetical protein
MSTRCQVQVIGENDDDSMVTLYHHTDGYPSYMVPLIAKAYRHAIKPTVFKGTYPNGTPFRIEHARAWQAARVGKVAGELCWADPGTMEPEAGHELHGDIEYLYRVHVSGGMHIGVIGKWEVEILIPNESRVWTEWTGQPTIQDMELHTPRTEVLKLSRAILRAERKDRKQREAAASA